MVGSSWRRRTRPVPFFTSPACLAAALTLSVATGTAAPQGRPDRLIVGSSNNFPPINLLDDSGRLTGFGRELSSAALAAVGIKPEYRHSDYWPRVQGWLEDGEIDLIHDTAYSRIRDQRFDFSDPILEMEEVIFVRQDQYAIQGLLDVLEARVACVDQHVSHLYLKTFPGIRCHTVHTPAEGMAALVSGDVEAFVYPKPIGLYIAQDLELQDRVKVVGDPLRRLTWHMMVREGDEQTLALVNEGLAAVRASGEYDRIRKRWLGKRVLAGYSAEEVWLAVVSVALLSLLLGVTLPLLFYTRRLRAARARLRDSEARWRSLVENAPDIVFLVDRGGRIQFINSVPKGLTPEETIGTSMLDYLPEPYRDKAQKALERVLNGGGPETFEVQARGDHDEPAWYSTRIGPLEEGGEVTGALLITHDISVRMEQEQRLRRQLDELRRFQEVTVGRELRMKELKDENRRLRDHLSEFREKAE